jgi:hypothetical protein
MKKIIKKLLKRFFKPTPQQPEYKEYPWWNGEI